MSYVTLICKQDLVNLLKYGEILVSDNIIEHYDKYESLSSDKDTTLRRLLLHSSPIENFSRIMALCFDHKARIGEHEIRVRIEDVLHIAPVCTVGELVVKNDRWMDGDLKFEKALWDKQVEEMEIEQDMRYARLGAHDLWAMLGIKEDIQKCESIITDDILREVYAEIHMGTHPSGEMSEWVYLMRYERHAAYPKKTQIGAMYDTVNIACNFSKKCEQTKEDIKDSRIFQFVDKLCKDYGNGIDATQIRKLFIESEETKGFRKNFDDLFIWAAFFYIFFKEHYSEEFTDIEILERSAKAFPINGFSIDSICMAIYLLGLSLRRETINALRMQKLELPILHSSALNAQKPVVNKTATDALVQVSTVDSLANTNVQAAVHTSVFAEAKEVTQDVAQAEGVITDESTGQSKETDKAPGKHANATDTKTKSRTGGKGKPRNSRKKGSQADKKEEANLFNQTTQQTEP